MSPAIVAIARTLSSEIHEREPPQQVKEATENSFGDITNFKIHRSSSFSSYAKRATNAVSHACCYNYDPYHQYCNTGSDYYKSYHLSYQAYCHLPKLKFALQDVRNFGEPLQSVGKISAQTSKFNAAKIRAAKLSRRLSQFRIRTLACIQRLALFTISAAILMFIFTRSIHTTKKNLNNFVKHPFNEPKLFEQYSVKKLVSFDHCNNFSEFNINLETLFLSETCVDDNDNDVFNNLFRFFLPSDLLPNIALDVFAKFYALGFLALLFVVSYFCEKIFACEISIQHTEILTEDYSKMDDTESCSDFDDDDEDDDETEKENEVYQNFELYDDLYWQCKPTVLRVPQISFFGAAPMQVIVTDIKISLIHLLPLRLISRIWGWANSLRLPIVVRKPLYIWYAKTFGCNLEEMLEQDLTKFKNLSEFFRRSLKPGVRPIGDAAIVSPVDGLIVQLEAISPQKDYVGSVKGIMYSVDNFLGPNKLPKIRSKNKLFSCVLYLAPGDYHRFHSPADWIVKSRRHFSGKLLSVKPLFVKQVPNLFSINERVIYFGEWKYGFFSMAAVGATNVGTINVPFDEDLKTNQVVLSTKYRNDKHFDGNCFRFSKGELFGEFNLGSTIVLIFEAPEQESQFLPKLLNQKIKYGQNVCSI